MDALACLTIKGNATLPVYVNKIEKKWVSHHQNGNGQWWPLPIAVPVVA